MTKTAAFSKASGFTLIEVLVAVVVFSLGIIALFGSFSLALNTSRNGRDLTTANHLAETKIEQLRLGGFDDIAIDTNPSPTAVGQLAQGQMKVVVDYYNGNTKIKLVTVKIYWQSRPESRAVTLTTLIGQGGIHG